VTTYDLLIRNATVYDGSGAPAVRASVGVRGDRIAALGDLDGPAAQEIDAAGLALAPGFIDVHAHDDILVLTDPDVEGKTMQGVTTVVVGNCGSGVVPYEAMLARFGARSAIDEDFPVWRSYGEYLDVLAARPPSLNVATLVGHGTLRYGVLGGGTGGGAPAGRSASDAGWGRGSAPNSEDLTRDPTAAELERMRAWLVEGLEAGAVGMATGLIYEPGRYSRTEEIASLAREVGRAGGVYASHMRNEAAGLLDSIRETVRIGEEGGCAVQVSHHKASGRDNWGRVHDSLRLIEQSRARGLDVTADQYPYTAGSTYFAAVVQNGALREDGAATSGIGRVRPEDVFIATARVHPEYEGRSLAELMDEWDLPVEDASRRLLDEEGQGCFVVLFMMDEADVRTVLAHPTTMIGTDGIDAGSKPHPRAFGTYPRILETYVRVERLLTLEQAIYKMSGMPAEKFNLARRGFVREGYFADLVLFDPARVADRATYQDPRRPPDGMPYVFVNGVAVVRGGEHTHARAGRPLRRARE
jgi:N-acyl-D-amino-acid deacylase